MNDTKSSTGALSGDSESSYPTDAQIECALHEWLTLRRVEGADEWEGFEARMRRALLAAAPTWSQAQSSAAMIEAAPRPASDMRSSRNRGGSGVTKYTTREISDKLRRYAYFVESEATRAQGIGEITGDDSDVYAALSRELDEVRNMATYLWECKGAI